MSGALDLQWFYAPSATSVSRTRSSSLSGSETQQRCTTRRGLVLLAVPVALRRGGLLERDPLDHHAGQAAFDQLAGQDHVDAQVERDAVVLARQAVQRGAVQSQP